MRRALYILCQCSWGAIQTLAGAVLFLIFAAKPHFTHHGAVVTRWQFGGSASLGMFIFLSDKHRGREADRVLAHEFGHTLQSLILGPLYLVVIALPSVIWAGVPALRRMRGRRGISYYRMYTERWANYLEERYIGDETPK